MGLVRRLVEMLLQAGISPCVGRNDERGTAPSLPIMTQAKPRFCAVWSILTTLPSCLRQATSPCTGEARIRAKIMTQGTSHRSAAGLNLPILRLMRKGVAARSYECCQMRAAGKPRGQAQPRPRGLPPPHDVSFHQFEKKRVNPFLHFLYHRQDHGRLLGLFEDEIFDGAADGGDDLRIAPVRGRARDRLAHDVF